MSVFFFRVQCALSGFYSMQGAIESSDALYRASLITDASVYFAAAIVGSKKTPRGGEVDMR